MHSTACGVGASATNLASLQTTCNSNSATATADAHKMVHHSNDDAMNKIPLKSASGLDDEEKNGGELMQDTAAAEEARREQMHANLLAWSKKLTIGVICFIGIALIGYVIISLVFSDWPKSTPLPRNITKELPTAIESTATPGPLLLSMSTNTTTAATNTTTSTRIKRSSTTLKENRTKSAIVKSKYRQIIRDNRESTATSFEHAAVCSDQQICSDVGSDILAKNGSAVDATIATMLCNGLTSIETMGFGGRFTMNIYDRESQQGYYVNAQPILIGNHSDKVFIVPGEVLGYHKAHQRFGKLPWRELLEASLQICNTGFTMSKLQETFVHRNWHLVKDSPQYQSVFINPTTGKLHETGSLLKPPQQLCNTYQLLAKNGASDFYSGTIAQMLYEDLKEMGSVINILNFNDAHLGYSSRMPLGEDTLLVANNESSGDLVAQILSILEEYNFKRDEESYARSMQRIIDATKKISDVKKIKFKAPNRNSQFTIVAPNGDAVAATSFINSDFGSGSIGTRTGLSLNNFAGKRCHSTQAPMLLLDAAGNIRMSIAANGIIDTVEVMARLLWLEEDIQTTVNQTHFSIHFDNKIVRHENNKFIVAVAQLLRNRGHELLAIDQSNVVSCATQRVARDLHVASRGGGVAGF